jgi:hypothetical protein
MKIISILTICLLLSGCSVIQPFIDKFMIAPYDNNEYGIVNKIRTTAQLSKKDCSNKSIMKTNSETIFSYGTELKNFSQYLPKNEQSIKPISQLYTMIEELDKRYQAEGNVSKTYCELKLTSIEESSEMIQKAIGKRPRP